MEVAELLAQKIKEFEAKSSTCELPTATRERIRERRARLETIAQLVNDADAHGSEESSTRQECLAALHDELAVKKNVESLTQGLQRKSREIAKDRDRLSSELSRAMQAKARVEQACKELQKHQRVLEEENRRISGAEERRRLDLEASCNVTIEGVRQKMAEHQTERSVQQKENVELRERFETFLEKYEDRERVLKEQQEAREREMSLFRQRLSERDKLHSEERQRTEELQEENVRLMQVESELRTQLQSYAYRFNSLQAALQTSNDGFEHYKRQMDDLQKEMYAVRKDNEELQETIKRGPQIKKQMHALTRLLETLRAQSDEKNTGAADPPIGTSTSSSSSCAPRR